MRLLAIAFAFQVALPALAVPTHVEAEYSISTAGMVIGRVAERYVREGDRYRIESTTRAEGVLKLFRDETVVLKSEGRVGAGGLQPLRFERWRSGDRSHDIDAEFDWPNSRLRSEQGGERTTHPLPPGTQDRLSIMYQFMHAAPGGEQVRVHMSNGRKVSRYTYRKVDEPRVETPAGAFATAHYERITDDPKDRRTQLWLATDHFNIPVRVVFEDAKGLRLEQVMTSLATR